MKFWLRPLGIPLWFILAVVLVVLLTRRAPAATVNRGSLATSFFTISVPPRITSIEESSTVTLDLSDLSGLTIGADIELTFSTANEILWTGSFGAQDGELTLNFHARLTLTAGTYSASHDTIWSLGPVEYLNPGGPVAGYSFGPLPESFTLTVPWGTDLSAVDLTLTDLFSLVGNDPLIVDSKLVLSSATLTTASVVPESGVLWLGLLPALALRRRRSP